MMDFYDALKNGTTEAQLKKAFFNALDLAKERINAEEKAKEIKKQKMLEIEKNRSELIKNLIPYINSLTNSSIANEKNIENILKDFEKNSENIQNLIKFFSKENKEKNIEFNFSNKNFNKFFDDLFFI